MTATVKDFLDQPVTGDTVTFQINPAGASWASGQASCQTVDGVCWVEVSSTQAGTFSVGAALAKGAMTPAQDVVWLADEVCGAECAPEPGVPAEKFSRVEVTLDGQPADDVTADQITVYAFDKWGNPVKNQGLTVAARGSDLRVQAGLPATDEAGKAVVRLYSKTAGAHQADVTAGGKTPAGGAPVTVHFRADEVCVAPGCAPDPSVPNERRTRVEVTVDDALADGVDTDAARVYAFDRLGNAVANVQVQAVAEDAGLKVAGSIAATSSDGTSDFTMTSAVAGGHQARVYLVVAGSPVEVKFTPQPLQQPRPRSAWSGAWTEEELSSPVTVNFAAGQPCVAPACTPDEDVPNDRRSRVEVNPDYQHADGTSRDVANVFIFDAQGNPVEGARVVSTTSAQALTVQPESDIARTSGAGVTSVWYTSPTAGGQAAEVLVEVGGRLAAVEFTPQPVPPASGPAPAGMASSPVTLHFVDVTAPAAPQITGPQNGDQLSDAQPVITGQGEPDAVVVVMDGSDKVCETTAAADGSWSCAPTAPLGEGQHELTAVQTDEAGNTSPPSAPVTVTVDTIAPDAPTVTSPTPGQSVDDGTVEVAGEAEPGSTVSVADADGTVLCTAQANQAGAWHCETTALADGPQTIAVTATDRAGNESDPTEVSFTVDADAPAAVVVTTPAEGQQVPALRPEFAGTAEPGATVTVREGAVELCQAAAAADGSWSCLPTADLAEGPHTVTAVATDAAGNDGPVVTRSFGVDTTAPEAPVVTKPADGEEVGTKTPTVEGTAEPGSEVTVDAGDGNVCTVTADAEGKFACTLPDELPEGPAVIEVTATDPAGNESDPTEVQVTVDTTAPAAPVVTKPADGEEVGTKTPTVEGTAEPGSEVKVDAGDGNACTTTADAEGKFACTLPNELPEGPAVIEVTATDPAGNVSDPTEVEVTVDTTAPAAPVVTKPADGEQVDTATPTVEGTAEPGSEVKVDAGDGNVCTTVADAQGKFSCTLTEALADGPAVIVVTATDAAGNESDPTEVPIVVDTDGPGTPVVTRPSKDEQVGDNTPTVEGKAEPGSTVTVEAGDGNACTTTADAEGKFSCTLPNALPDGPAVIEVTAV
ncbi:MAG: Ig-like domain-containing protein, partial [Propionibacteriaceae bacterium]|nr:Ig-like domain-containing protein [Propionibacteriaceae bacterium]